MRNCLSNLIALPFLLAATTTSGVFAQTASRPIAFGTTLDSKAVVASAQKLAESIVNPGSAQYRAKGDQKRTYRFEEANADEPYRLCVPSGWDGKSKLPLVMFLHGSGSNESTYLDQDNKKMVTLANEHGYLLVSPLGDKGAYGNYLRLTAPFGNAKAAADLMAQVTSASELTNQLSEKDVINVLELVLHEYPIDSSALFLTGHSMGSGGTWYIGGKYRSYWKGLAPMSGPFVQETGYPWDSLHTMNFFVTEGTQAPSLDGSRLLRDWMKNKNYNLKYKEVNADHGGMVPIVLPDVFNFFDSCRNSSVAISSKQTTLFQRLNNDFSANYMSSQSLRITLPTFSHNSNVTVTILDNAGKSLYNGVYSTAGGDVFVNNLSLSAGAYRALIRTGSQSGCADFIVVK
jgi:poly(3-hydroxybutyrate) depolymerase